MRFISTRLHGVADYAVGLLLILAPYVLGFANGGPAQWVPMLLGAFVILYSLFTQYEFGLFGLLPMPVHLGLDIAGGILLAASPWLFGFANTVFWPHVIVGIIEIATAACTRPAPEHLPRTAARRG